MPSSAEVQQYRSQIVALTDAAAYDLAALWAMWSWDDPAAVTAAALAVVPDVVWTYQDASAGLAADTYDVWREQEGVPGRFLAEPAAVAVEDQIAAGVRNAVGPLWTADPDADAARALLAGMTARIVARGAADTVVDATRRDERAVGWSRIARAGACRFCRMLAGRGGVYRSEQSSRFASHDHCHCVATPSWDPDAPDMPVLAYVASQRKQTAADRARVRAFLDANYPL